MEQGKLERNEKHLNYIGQAMQEKFKGKSCLWAFIVFPVVGLGSPFAQLMYSSGKEIPHPLWCGELLSG